MNAGSKKNNPAYWIKPFTKSVIQRRQSIQIPMKKTILVALLGLCLFTQSQTLDPALASKLQTKLDSLKIAYNLKGMAACIVYPGMGTWKGASGISYLGSPITSDLLFGIASNTKLFTGVLLLKLAENKLIQLDDSLYKYLPKYTNIDSTITIRQLLNHTSGLYDVTSVPGYPDSMLTNPTRLYTAAELLKWAKAPLFAPGKGWDYCNTNYLLAGMIAEKVTGKSYGQLLRDSILSPLNMDSTFLDVYDSILYPVAHPWQAGVNNMAISRKAVNSAAWAAGAMYSTAGEMTQWYEALMKGQVINANSLREMTTFVGTGNYGIGISKATVVGRTVWTHGGTIWGGYNSTMMYDTATGIVVCVLINQLPGQAYQAAIQLLSTVVNHAVGIHENKLDKGGMAIYPNPASSVLHIPLLNTEIQKLEITNALGELVLESDHQTTIDLSKLPKGIFFVKIITNNDHIIQKLMIQ